STLCPYTTLFRSETSDMGHQGNQGCLPEQCTLTTHIWAGENNYLLIGLVEHKIVMNITFTRSQVSLYYRVAAFFYHPFFTRVKRRLLVMIVYGICRKRACTIKNCHDVPIALHRGKVIVQFV